MANRIVGQRETIKLMKEGYALHWVGGLSPHAWLSKGTEDFPIKTDTVFKLVEKGLVVPYTEPWVFPHMHGTLTLKVERR